MTLKGLKLQVIMHSKKKSYLNTCLGIFPSGENIKKADVLALGCFTTVEMVLYKIHWTIKM